LDSPFKDQLNPIFEFFQVSNIYTKTQILSNSSSFKGNDPLWKIYLAKQESDYAPMIIIDEGNLINPSDNMLSLSLIEKQNDLRRCLSSISPKAIGIIEKAMKEHGHYVPEKNLKKELDWDMVSELDGINLVWRPVHKLKNPDFVKDMDWDFFIDKLIKWDSDEKDPRLNLIHKTQLLKGYEPRANTHSLIVLNAGVGKSIHFQIHGINYDKVTRNAFLGFAKSKTEINIGTLDGTELPIGIDQIEVGSWGIMDFMFNIMEYGEARVSSGAVDFKVKSKSPISLIANPIGDDYNPEKSFGAILSHLTDNPAIGRRFGVIAYGTDYNIIETKSTSQSMEWWKESSTFFRAVEEYIKDKIVAVYRDEKLWGFLNKPIVGYKERISTIANNSSDSTIKRFLIEHSAAGQSRVRSAAFNASLVDHLKDLFTDNFKIDDVFEHAEENLLPQIISINVESANNIVKTIGAEENLYREVYLDAAPDYMKEIIIAVEYMRRNKVASSVFLLSTTDYRPAESRYQNIGQCIRKLIKRKRGIAQFNKMTTKWFNFAFEPMDNDLKITLFDNNPISIIPIIPNIPKIPKGGDSDSENVQPSKGVQRVQRVSDMIKDVIKYMSPQIKYSTDQISAYMNWSIAETEKVLQLMARDGTIWNNAGRWQIE
jgi:hypothetical protein